MVEPELALVTAVVAFAISGSRDEWGYWTLTVSSRRDLQQEWRRDRYESLTTDELVDVLESIDVP
jgi:hypothetical protein